MGRRWWRILVFASMLSMVYQGLTQLHMSKSAPSDQSRINLLDSKDVIVNKIKRCKTDSFSGLEFDNPERPECNNLLSMVMEHLGGSWVFGRNNSDDDGGAD